MSPQTRATASPHASVCSSKSSCKHSGAGAQQRLAALGAASLRDIVTFSKGMFNFCARLRAWSYALRLHNAME